jgi:GT2 family glycosyltransferase
MAPISQAASVSILLPTQGRAATLGDAVESILKCNPLEVIVIAMQQISAASLPTDNRVKIIVKSGVKLSEARNIGIQVSSGSIIGFTDDDCTVKNDWISSALDQFANEKVAVVGGPGLTHPSDPLLAKCSGAVLASRFGTYTSSSRYSVRSQKLRNADERNLSTCNLFFRRSALASVGLFETQQPACEENDLIQRIRAAGFTTVYAPLCIVNHHRRPLFRPFLKQIGFYAYGRAVFTFREPKEFRPIIAAPSLLVLTTLLLPILYVQSSPVFLFLAGGYILYLTLSALSAIESTISCHLNLRYSAIVWLGIVLMHYWYGASFLLSLGKILRESLH